MPRTARSAGVSGMLHRTIVRRVDLIEGIVSFGLEDRAARESRGDSKNNSATNTFPAEQDAKESKKEDLRE